MNKALHGLTCVLVLALMLPAGPAAGEMQESMGSKGYVDWGRMMVAAIGSGAPPAQSVNPAQARAMAKRSAVVAARRNLLEVIQGVRVDSRTTVKDFMVVSDIIQSEVHGLLENARVLKTETFADGSVEATVGLALAGELGPVLFSLPSGRTSEQQGACTEQIKALSSRVFALEQALGRMQEAGYQARIQTLEQRLAGLESGLAELQEITTRAKAESTDSNPADTFQDKGEFLSRLASLEKVTAEIRIRLDALETGPKARPLPESVEKRLPNYTGLVIDARGLGFKPCLKPHVLSGRDVLYPGEYIDPDQAARNGYVRYFGTVAAAEQSAAAGELPLRVRAAALGAEGSGRLVLGQPETRTLIRLVESGSEFLAQCKVAIVL